jgi:hypothetical protein
MTIIGTPPFPTETLPYERPKLRRRSFEVNWKSGLFCALAARCVSERPLKQQR